jgi:hypothetical protein
VEEMARKILFMYQNGGNRHVEVLGIIKALYERKQTATSDFLGSEFYNFGE